MCTSNEVILNELRLIHCELKRLHIAVTNQVHSIKYTVIGRHSAGGKAKDPPGE